MIPNSGIAVFTVAQIGVLRLDNGGLRLITPFDASAKARAQVEDMLRDVWDLVDSHHATPGSILNRLVFALHLKEADIYDVTITDAQPIPAPPEGSVS